jgi:hypothetical protein
MSKYLTNFAQVIHMGAQLVPLEIPGYGEDTPEGYVQHDPQPFRFKGIVDGQGYQTAAVTDKYALVQNVDLGRAVKDALIDEGITDIKMGSAMYRSGRTRFSLKLPSETFSVPGDPSGLMPLIHLGNDYGGGGSVIGDIGLWRAYCTNEQFKMTRGLSVKLPHRGELDYGVIYGAVRPMIAELVIQSKDAHEVARLLAETEAPMAWVEQLLEDTGKRYHDRLRASIQRNIADLGPTAWAVTQGITEHATHERPAGWATNNWSGNATADLLATVRA